MDKLVVSGEEFAPVMNEILSSGGSVSLVVSGSSMDPYLKHGRDIVTLRTCTDQDLIPGRIVLFKRQDRSMVLHRIRKILPNGQIVMNGDAQSWCEIVSPDRVIAVVTSVERKGRQLSCERVWFRLWNLLWYPTRPVRPAIFKLGYVLFHKVKR